MSLHTGATVTGLKEERFEQKTLLAFPSPSVFISVLQVTKIDSTDRVTVQWVDGSESQFNVHPTGFSHVSDVYKTTEIKQPLTLAPPFRETRDRLSAMLPLPLRQNRTEMQGTIP